MSSIQRFLLGQMTKMNLMWQKDPTLPLINILKFYFCYFSHLSTFIRSHHLSPLLSLNKLCKSWDFYWTLKLKTLRVKKKKRNRKDLQFFGTRFHTELYKSSLHFLKCFPCFHLILHLLLLNKKIVKGISQHPILVDEMIMLFAW